MHSNASFTRNQRTLDTIHWIRIHSATSGTTECCLDDLAARCAAAHGPFACDIDVSRHAYAVQTSCTMEHCTDPLQQPCAPALGLLFASLLRRIGAFLFMPMRCHAL